MTGIRLDQRGRVRILTLDRPEKRNAFDHTLATQAIDAVSSADEDAGVGAIVLTGAGDTFSAGVDLEWLQAMAGSTAPQGQGYATVELAERLRATDTPVIVAVNGPAVGMGTTLCLHADLVIAAESARFRTPFTALGVGPELGSSWLLPQLIGQQRAAWMLLSSEWVDAPTAVGYGLVFEVVADDRLVDRAVERAAAVAAHAPASVAAVKRTLRAWREQPVAAASVAENEEFRRLLRPTD